MTNARYELVMNKAGRVTFETRDSTILRALSERRKIDVRIGDLIIAGYVTKIDNQPMFDHTTIYTVEVEQSGPPKLYSSLGYPSVTGRFSSYVTKAEAETYAYLTGKPEPEHANCRCTTLPILKETKMKKFAVGSISFETLVAAVAYAKHQVEENGQARNITKIIRVVRRKPQPIVVESVA